MGDEVNLTVRVRDGDGDEDESVRGVEAATLARLEAFPEVFFFMEEANCFGGSEGRARGW